MGCRRQHRLRGLAPRYPGCAFSAVLQDALGGARMDDDMLRAKLEENLSLLQWFARSLRSMAVTHNPELGRFVTSAPEEAPLDMNCFVSGRSCTTRVSHSRLNYQCGIVAAEGE